MPWLVVCCVYVQGVQAGVPDPAIIEVPGHGFYLFCTGRGIPIHFSSDLLQWQRAGKVFETAVPSTAHNKVPEAGGVWAPDVSFYNKRYWLYYSVSTMGSQHSVIGLTTNTTLNPSDPNYTWEDRGIIVESHPGKVNYNAIDPAAFTDQEGRRWLVWGSYWSGIKLARLDPETGHLLSNTKIHALARRPGNPGVIEGAFIIHRGDYYYLFVSYDRCCDGIQSNYNVRVGRSMNPIGPYHDFKGRDMMNGGGTLILASYDRWRGPGHNSIIHTFDQDFLVHHVYDAQKQNPQRELQIRALAWSQDGWPLVLEPYTGIIPPPVFTGADLNGRWKHSVDFGPDSEIELLPDGTIAKRWRASWTWTDGQLILQWPQPHSRGRFWIDQCIVSPDGLLYTGYNQNGQLIRGLRPNPTQRHHGAGL